MDNTVSTRHARIGIAALASTMWGFRNRLQLISQNLRSQLPDAFRSDNYHRSHPTSNQCFYVREADLMSSRPGHDDFSRLTRSSAQWLTC